MGRSMSTLKLKLTNQSRRDQRIILEPIAWEYVLPSGQTYDIIAEGDLAYPLGVDVTDDDIVISAFDSKGARLSVFENGSPLAPNG